MSKLKTRSILVTLLATLLFISCKEESTPAPKPETIMDLKVMQQRKLSSGQIVAEPTQAIIHVWKAENRDFDVSSSPDIHYGYVFDKQSQSFVTMDYGAIGSKMRERIEAGKYFVHVLLPKSSNNTSLAYSYSYFEIKTGETLNLVKTFSHDISPESYEDWEKNK